MTVTSFEEYLEALIVEKSTPENALYRCARYALLSGGKRIRPQLTLATGELFHAPFETLLAPAAAIELIHTYSLIHDDLPAMDDDDVRRGKPSLHVAFGEAEAILTGDYLLTYAFELLSNAPHLSDATRLKLIHTLAVASGSTGMIGGQLMDIQEHPDRTTVNAKKTGALIHAAVLFGAIVAKVPQGHYHQLSLFGASLGQLFQLCDDLLDGECDGSATSQARQLYTDTCALLEPLPGNLSPLQEICLKVINQI